MLQCLVRTELHHLVCWLQYSIDQKYFVLCIALFVKLYSIKFVYWTLLREAFENVLADFAR